MEIKIMLSRNKGLSLERANRKNKGISLEMAYRNKGISLEKGIRVDQSSFLFYLIIFLYKTKESV